MCFSIGARAEWPTPKSNHPRTFNRTNRRDVERVANESACTGNAATSNGDGRDSLFDAENRA